jgi:hypothetical protein
MKLSRMAAALIVTGLVSTALAAGTGVAAAAAGPVLNGPEQGFAAVGSTVAISGTAPVGTAKSSSHLTQIPVHINGPATQTATRDAGYHLTGQAIPYTVVKFHLHAKGTAPNDYNMVRTSNVQSNGNWAFKIASDTDYRIFAISGANLTVTPKYLLQDR